MTYTLSKHYALKWQFINHQHYKVTTCRKVINTQTGMEIRRVMNGRCAGYWIAGRFIALSKINAELELINYSPIPF